MADAIDLSQVLDIDVDQLAGIGAFLATRRLNRLQSAELVEPQVPQDAADRGQRELELGGDLLARAPLTAQGFDGGRAAGGVWLGDEWGREERSPKLSMPSASKRSTHLATVFGVVLNRRTAAAWSNRHPRPRASSLLDLWASGWQCCAYTFGPGRIARAWQLQLAHARPNGQPDESSHLAQGLNRIGSRRL
jgi:hypothetical protein